MNITMYSGYVHVDNTSKEIHYTYIKSTAAKTENSSVPLIVWFTGGPGCSSMLAMFQENGPYVMRGKDQKIEWNNATWTDFGDMLWIDQPAGVGFSTCDSGSLDCHTNDNQTGRDNLHVLREFMKEYGV